MSFIKTREGEPASSKLESSDNVIFITENIDDVYTEFVSKMILDVSYDLFKVISNLEKKTYSRGLKVLDLLALANLPDAISSACIFDKGEDGHTVQGYVNVLKRNLAAFDLDIEAVIGDGDCAFRSLAKQIVRLSEENDSFKEHLRSLNLLKTEGEDTFQLRQLFADKIAEGDDELLAFLPFESNDGDIDEKVNEFRSPGVYDRTLGDLIMKTCAEILEVTIVVVTSNESVPWLLFVPEKFSSKESIFVAFHFYGAGHYDSTRKAEEDKLSHDAIAK